MTHGDTCLRFNRIAITTMLAMASGTMALVSEDTFGEMKYVVELHGSFQDFLRSQDRVEDSESADVLKKHFKSFGETMPMRSMAGDTYLCAIPDYPLMGPLPEKDEGNVPECANETCANDEDDANESRSRVNQLREKLEPLSSGPCFSMNMGYWTYELCPMRKVTQYHREGRKRTMSFDLGTYANKFDAELLTESETSTEKALEGLDPPIFQQRYVTDDKSPRTSIVQYACDRSEKKAVDRLVAVVEEPTHTYTFHFATKKVCNLEHAAYLLLQPLRRQCLRKVESWWTYEVCAGRSVRQYHKEDGKPKIVHILGRYDQTENAVARRRARPRRDKKIQTLDEIYTGGSTCDLTSKPRTSKVLYRCSTSEDYSVIESIAESKPCEYVVTVATPLLCQHPAFTDQGLSASANAATIHCVPENDFR